MYKKRQIVNRVATACDAVISPFCSEPRIARPLSYFARGGVDLDASDRAGIPGYADDAESISDGIVDMATDPRVSKLDLMAEASRDHYDRSTKRSVSKITGEQVSDE